MSDSNNSERVSEIQCPACGYYCNGKGGFGCIDKPTLVAANEKTLPKESVSSSENRTTHTGDSSDYSKPLEDEGKLRNKLADVVFGHNGCSLGAVANIDAVLDELMALFSQELAKAEERVQKRIEWEAHKEASERVREEMQRLAHPAIRVVGDDGKYLHVLQNLDISYGGDAIQIKVRLTHPDTSSEGGKSDEQTAAS